MKRIVVFQEHLTRRYSAPRLSLAYLFVILFNAAALIIPFFFFNGTHGDFWIQYGTYRERPEVAFQYKVIVVLESTSLTSNLTKEIFVSNIDSLNVLRPETYRLASIQFQEDDIDRDGKFDSFTLESDVPLYPDEQIQSMQALLFFKYRLQKRVKLDMESIAYTSAESVLPMSGFDSKGSLMLRQSNPLGVRGYTSTLYAEETPLIDTIDSLATNRIKASNVNHVLEKYRARSVVADYVEHYPIKLLGRSSVPGEAEMFHLKMKVDIPEQEILYIATLMEVLQDGWIKYLSVVVVCFFLLNRIKSMVFGCQL
jgi:hypothetical protein